ncbi:hypothetical protein EYF80_030212 [Liparis tanakae]|uniref:Uncharacterized protein n=1 Tax=Liparis tanakae TaxID=230148 RepID=A0A4Z2H3V7_9TELE|nr:hypothetical protein EYF80_030212 [Liparis tanakae]
MPRLNEARCGCQARCRQLASISCEISCEITSRKSHILRCCGFVGGMDGGMDGGTVITRTTTKFVTTLSYNALWDTVMLSALGAAITI